jgi:hypothetical protein
VRVLAAFGLLLLTVLALSPDVQQAVAYKRGYVDMPPGEPAFYSVSSLNGLVLCKVPKEIKVRSGQTATHTFFQCANNYNAPVELYWSVVPASETHISASGSALMSAGTSDCRSATITAGTTTGSKYVKFQGVTSGSDFFTEIYFDGYVTVQSGGSGLGGGCP